MTTSRLALELAGLTPSYELLQKREYGEDLCEVLSKFHHSPYPGHTVPPCVAIDTPLLVL